MLWLTRPEPDSSALAEEMAEIGVDSIVAPVMHIVPQAFTLPAEKPDALLLTSRHGAQALPAAWRDLPVFCVGKATAEEAAAMGYEAISHGERDALTLLSRITERMEAGQRLLYLSGTDTRHDIHRLLAANQIEVERIVAYDAEAVTALPAAFVEAASQGKVDGALFFSPRSAQLACTLLTNAGLETHAAQMDAYCFSLNVAEAAGALPWKRVYVSHTPSRAAILAMLQQARTSIAS